MRKIRSYVRWMLPVCLAGALFLSACSDSDSSKKVSYRMTVTNLTNDQPLSPPAVVLHTAGYRAWELGTGASEGLEMLAEGGEVATFLDAADSDMAVVATAAGMAAIAPGGSMSVEMEISAQTDLRVSFAAMLVNTNDAFTGIVDTAIGDLARDGSLSVFTAAYDAGTEVNSETADSIPGPAAGGEGFNPALGDHGFITIHPGVVSGDDGLTASVLGESHRWQNPVARLTITRTQ